MQALLSPDHLSSVHGPVAEEGHRFRLLVGMAGALVEKGFPATTIADVARHARVSKRTFYEHFASKEDCFIACYESASELLLSSILNAVSSEMPWDRRVHAATGTYLAMLEANPALTRTLMMDIYAAGPKALKVRRKVQKRFADVFRQLVDRGKGEFPKGRDLTPAMAAAVIGGINELVLLAVEEGRANRLTELGDTANGLVSAVLRSLVEEPDRPANDARARSIDRSRARRRARG